MSQTAEELESASRREVAIEIIADKLKIPTSAVSDETELGDKYRKIASVVTQRTDCVIQAHHGMRVGELLKQLQPR